MSGLATILEENQRLRELLAARERDLQQRDETLGKRDETLREREAMVATLQQQTDGVP